MTTITPPLPVETAEPLLADSLAWDGKRLVVTDETLIDSKLRRKALSASTSKSMQSCAARWVGERLLRSDIEDPFAPAPLGTSAHSIMEDLFDVEHIAPNERTMETAARLVNEAAEQKWPDNPDETDAVRAAVRIAKARWIEEVRQAYEGLYVIENPAEIDVHSRELQIDGLTINGVPTNGFIDRVRRGTNKESGKTGLIVEDYKGLAVDTPIPTPTGWTTMGQLNKGDVVLGSDGRPTTVTAKSGTHHRLCYEVTFSDGSKVVCDNVHLWQVVDTYRRKAHGSETVDADELYRRVSERGTGNISIHIPNTAPLELPEAELSINPWVLGAWLGDGKGSTGELTVGEQDLAEMTELVETHWGVSRTRVERTSHQITLSGDRRDGALLTDWREIGDSVFTKAPLRRHLSEAGLLGNKHIPAGYQRASYTQRLELLQGLMDTDGSFNSQRGRAVFVTTNRRLAEGVRELISSLGVTVQWFEKDYENAVRPAATMFKLEFRPLEFVPFQLERKAAPVRAMQASYDRFSTVSERSLRRDVVGMKIVDTVPTECIAVDAPDHLYLCGTTMIPTHNTGKVLNTRFGDDHGDQIRIYAAAVKEKFGDMPVGGTVLYTKFGKSREIDLRPAAMAKTLKTFELSWKRHNSYMKSASFPTKVSALCGWCPLVNACPVAAEEGKTVSEKVADQIHSAVELGIPVIRPIAGPDDTSVDFDPDMAPDTGSHELVFYAPEEGEIPAAIAAEVEREAEAAAHMYSSGENPTKHSVKDGTMTESTIITEGKPWEETTPEGEINPSAYKVTAAFGLAELAAEALHKADMPLNKTNVAGLANTFYFVVSRAQKAWTGSVSLQDMANTRLRGALRTVIETLPLPLGQDLEAWNEWVDAAVKRTKAISTVAISVLTERPNPRPWEVLAVEAPAKQEEEAPAPAPKAPLASVPDAEDEYVPPVPVLEDPFAA